MRKHRRSRIVMRVIWGYPDAQSGSQRSPSGYPKNIPKQKNLRSQQLRRFLLFGGYVPNIVIRYL